MAPRASASYRTAVAATAALLAVAGTAAAQSAALCQAQWNTAQRTYQARLQSYQRAQEQYRAAQSQYNRDYNAWFQAWSEKNNAEAYNRNLIPGGSGITGTQGGRRPVPYVPPRPQRPINRAGPRPQPPSQFQYQSCLRQADAIEENGNTVPSLTPEPEPAPAPACEGGCCDDLNVLVPAAGRVGQVQRAVDGRILRLLLRPLRVAWGGRGGQRDRQCHRQCDELGRSPAAAGRRVVTQAGDRAVPEMSSLPASSRSSASSGNAAAAPGAPPSSRVAASPLAGRRSASSALHGTGK